MLRQASLCKPRSILKISGEIENSGTGSISQNALKSITRLVIICKT